MRDFFTTAEVGERLGVNARHVTRLIKLGRLPFVRNGRRITIPRPAWESFVADRSAEALAALTEGKVMSKLPPRDPNSNWAAFWSLILSTHDQLFANDFNNVCQDQSDNKKP